MFTGQVIQAGLEVPDGHYGGQNQSGLIFGRYQFGDQGQAGVTGGHHWNSAAL